MKKIILLCYVFALLFFYSDVFADTLYLKNGIQHIGQAIKQDDEKVVFKIGEGEDSVEITFFNDEILRVEKAESSSFIITPPVENKKLKIPEPIFTPLEKEVDEVSDRIPFKADGGFQPESDPPLVEMPPSEQTVKERSSLTGFTSEPLITEPTAEAQVKEESQAKEAEQVELKPEEEPKLKIDKKTEVLEILSKTADLEDISKIAQLEGLSELTEEDLLSEEKDIVEELTALLDKEELYYFSQINSVVSGSMGKTMGILTSPEALNKDAEKLPQMFEGMSKEIEGIIGKLDNLEIPEIFVNFHKGYLDNLNSINKAFEDMAKGDILSSQSKIAELQNINIKIQEELEKILIEKKKSTSLDI